jgi:hypothetical protein
MNPIIMASPNKIGCSTARDQSFGWGAAFVDTAAADVRSFYERGFVACFGERCCQGGSCLPGADDYSVVFLGRGHSRVGMGSSLLEAGGIKKYDFEDGQVEKIDSDGAVVKKWETVK